MLILKKQFKAVDCTLLGADMHAHILPGLDDGAMDLNDSVSMASGLIDMGYEALHFTPHVYPGVFDNTNESIEAGHKLFQNGLNAAGLNIPSTASAEYFVDDSFIDRVKSDSFLVLPGNRVLIEMSFYGPSPGINSVVFELKARGYEPILAHPERYRYFFGKNLVALKGLRERGCLLQGNILSFEGFYGEDIRQAAWNLWKEGMIDFLGTDLHNTNQLHRLRVFLASKKGKKLLRDQEYLNKTLLNAQ